MADPTFPIVSGFKGLNNKLDPTAAGPQWLLQAENVLCDNGNYLIRRPGYTLFFINVTDMFGTLDERLFVVTSTNTLYEVYSDSSYRQRATGFVGGPFQWAELGYAVFAMSESAAWCIYPDRVVAWGIPISASPTLEVAVGSLLAGTYLAATVLMAADGRLGGSIGVSSIVLNGSQGITVHSLPISGYSTYLYLSQPDGTELYQAAVMPESGIVTISTPAAEGPRLETLNYYPPPKGGIISAYGNRMMVAIWEPQYDRSVLYWSLPDSPHWFELDTSYQIVPGKPTLLAVVPDGLLIGTDRFIYAVGMDGFAHHIASISVIPDTLVRNDDGTVTFWTDRGLATYPPLTLVTDPALLPDNRTLSTMSVFDYMGSRYAVVSMRGSIKPKVQRHPFTPLSVVVKNPMGTNAIAKSTASGVLNP